MKEVAGILGLEWQKEQYEGELVKQRDEMSHNHNWLGCCDRDWKVAGSNSTKSSTVLNYLN